MREERNVESDEAERSTTASRIGLPVRVLCTLSLELFILIKANLVNQKLHEAPLISTGADCSCYLI